MSTGPETRPETGPETRPGTGPGTGIGTGTAFGLPQAPAIVPPKGGGAIRGIGESFAANPVTGTAGLSVPLPLSQARGSFTPALALEYDSGSGNGVFGYGWSLRVDAVTRTTDRGLPRYADATGIGDAPAAEEDTFSLSGAEDLVPVLEPHGGRWRHRERDRAEGGRRYRVRRYRPRVEAAFARIERWTDAASGDVHWRAISRDDVTTVYGRTPDSRVADPADPRRVFSWLVCESHDDLGNAVRYEYKAEDSAGVDVGAAHERGRTAAARGANRHLKRIRYGNRVSRLVDPDPDAGGWLFEVVLDYGEHDEQAPTPRERRPWTARLDPFSTHRPGFEVRSYRLCRRVLVFHHFPGEDGVGADCLVRSLDLTYRGDPRRGQPGGSFLVAVEQAGYRRRVDPVPGDTRYLRRAWPPVRIRYTEAGPRPEVRRVDTAGPRDLPAVIGAVGARWVDLDGEGLPGVLVEQAGSWFYAANRGGGRLAAVRQVAPLPSMVPPAPARPGAPPSTVPSGEGRRLVDLAGDGRLDLVDLDGPAPGYFRRSSPEGWETFRAFAGVPAAYWDDPTLRMLDLTGDGLPDVLVGEDDVWFPSRGHEGFGAAHRLESTGDPGARPYQVLRERDGAIHVADMTGDGLGDLVRIRAGEVCYWPNRGHGRFGPKVVMDGAPRLDEPDRFDPSRVRLADVDGSGTTDLVYLHAGGIRIHRNLSGNRWAPPEQVTLALPRAEELAAVELVDLLGTGTACLVWPSPLPGEAGRSLRYLDLSGGTKPHLLAEVDNGLGALTRIGYAPSTRYWLADRAAGRPWSTTLPFPVHVVDRVEVCDLVGGSRLVTRYAYHDGHFDPVERAFHGFGRVERRDAERIGGVGDVPTLLTRSWFHTGARPVPGAGDAPLGSVLPDGLTAEEERQAHRALKGSLLREEVYGLDGSEAADRPYRVAEHGYGVRLLQPAPAGADPQARPRPALAEGRGHRPHAVFLVHPRETVTSRHERALFAVGGERVPDPQVTHELALAVDDFGTVTSSASVAYGRRHPDPDPLLTDADRAAQAAHHLVHTEIRVTNAVDEDAAYRVPLPHETRAWHVTGLDPGPAGRFTVDELREALARVTAERPAEEWDPGTAPAHPARRLVQHTRSRWRRDDLAGPLPPGRLESRALPFDSHRLALTPGLLAAGFGDRPDAAELPAVLTGEGGYLAADGGWWAPSGRVAYSPDPAHTPEQELAHARDHFFVPLRFTDPFGGVTSATYDRYDLLPLEVRDPLGNRTTAGERDPATGEPARPGLDYRVLAARLVSDPNGNRREVAFDALGQVAGTAARGRPGERLGDTLDGFDPDPDPALVAAYLDDPHVHGARLLAGAGTRVLHDLHAADRGRGRDRRDPVAVATLARETHAAEAVGGDHAPVRHRFAYSDGLGREVQRKHEAGDGPAGAWIGSGWTVFDSRGNPVRRYEPFASRTHRFEAAVTEGVGAVLFHDPLDRVVATLFPDGTWEKVVTGPWQAATWDACDTVLTDPGTDADVAGHVRAHLAAEPWQGWHARRIGGGLGPHEREAARRTAAHAGTPTRRWVDALDRTVLVALHNRMPGGTDQQLATRRRLDVVGQEREVVDALGRVVARYGYDLLGSRVRQLSMDAGEQVLLADVAGAPIRTWNGRGFRTRTGYDGLRRPVAGYVAGGDLPGEVLAERTEYGEALDGDHATSANLRGRVYRRFDAAGVAVNVRFDFKGNLVESSRRLARDYRGTPDWSGEVALEDEEFRASTRYDALDRPVELVSPDGSRVLPAYDAAGQVVRLAAVFPGEAGGPAVLVERIERNARGQRTAVTYGNGVRTGYDYDPQTFRLIRLRSTRGAEVVQDLRYTYDPMADVTHVEDTAQPDAFFAGRRVGAGADYVYDATYRLVWATGREQLGLPDGAGGRDPRPVHPGDGAALGRYVQEYAFDEVGNLLAMSHRSADQATPGWTRRYRYAEPGAIEPGREGNRLSAVGSGDDPREQGFGYDAHGNVTAMPGLSLLRWDVRDQLVAVARQVVGEGTPETTYYVYDSFGERVRAVTDPARGPGAGPPDRPVGERIYLGPFEIHRDHRAGAAGGRDRPAEHHTLHVMDGADRVALVETRDVGGDGPVNRLVRYQLGDRQSSVRVELDERARLISYEEFHPFGSTALLGAGQVEALPKRYRYTGAERDAESGLDRHGARYYVPWLGRWTRPDPAGLVDGTNPYSYVRNNPVRLVDPTGLQGEPEQLWFSQAPAYWQPVTATATTRGITDVDRANLTKAAQMWGQPTPVQAGHLNRPFVLIPAGETEFVYAQGQSSNASQGGGADRAAAARARAAGLFARIGGVDTTAVKGTVYGHPPISPAFQTPGFLQWQPGTPTPPPTLPPPPGQQLLPFDPSVFSCRRPPAGSPAQLELPFSTGIQPAPARPPAPPAPVQLELPFGPPPASSSGGGGSRGGAPTAVPFNWAPAGNAALTVTRATVPGVVEAEVGLGVGAMYAHAAGYTALGGALETTALAVPVVGAGAVVGAGVGNLAESGARSLGASEPVAEGTGALAAAASGAGVGALIGSAGGGIGAVPGAIIGGAVGLAAYAITKIW